MTATATDVTTSIAPRRVRAPQVSASRFLDIAHQVEVLDLCANLHEQGRTLVMVPHDLNQACRYATRILAMRDGVLVAEGAPGDVVDAELVHDVFGLERRVIPDPETGTPLVVPAARRAVAAAPVT